MSEIFGLIFTVLFLAVLVGALIYYFISEKKRKDSQWVGVVIDKNIRETVHDDSNSHRDSGGGINIISISANDRSGPVVTHRFELTIKTDTGEQINNWEVTSGSYELINIGDRCKKNKGTNVLEPLKKTEPIQSETPPTTTPPPVPPQV
ncbi:MAG: hypothetical protein Q7T74_04570 [Candidatus Saccharibacteria bacterium]|nr:hypothetical protein [Candidatus Saccharibacteria bacterium]